MNALALLMAFTMAPPDNDFSELAGRIERFASDYGSLERTYPIRQSMNRFKRLDAFFRSEISYLEKLDAGNLTLDGRIDRKLLQNLIERERFQIARDIALTEETRPLIPFLDSVVELEEARRRFEPIEPDKVAAKLDALAKAVAAARAGAEKATPSRMVANRAVTYLRQLDGHLEAWFNFYKGYDPLFTWWCSEPYKSLDKALAEYTNWVRDKLVGIPETDKTTIIGDPIGRDALIQELRFEMIPYTPEELIEIANREFAWCDKEMLKASRELGYGDDWKKALEHVKGLYVQPGDQPKMIRELALEATEFVESRNLVTVPPLAKETWRMEMLSAEAQLQSPFFLGGEVIRVAFPTDGMSHEAKLMSLRGNNRHFARATVHHELIPGHHLQGFMLDRYRTYRRPFGTPFWTEGWALYWEMLLWDKGFPKTPENRIGMLFWRMHRCARIIFSLGFHTGKMTPQQCIDFLVDRVGHERENATAEVRRSFAGNYGPLYQIAYMIGGLQFRELHRELVDSGKMTDRQFHDRILQSGGMPVAMVRATLVGWPSGDPGSWRFYPGL